MQLNLIKLLAAHERRIQDTIQEWYNLFYRSRVSSCSSLGELNAVWLEIERACVDEEGQIQDLPGLLHVDKCFSYDAVRQKLKE